MYLFFCIAYLKDFFDIVEYSIPEKQKESQQLLTNIGLED